MTLPVTQKILNRIDSYLYDPRLDAETLLRKRWAWLWMVVTCSGVIFTIIYFLLVLELWPLWWSGATFVLCYIIGFPLYRRSKRFDLVINTIFSIFIVMAFFTILECGGFPSSLGLIFVGLNCAMASVLTGRIRWTIGMFVLYCMTILLIGLLQPYLETPDYITPRAATNAFVVETFWITACTLLLVLLFIRDQRRFEKAEADRLKMIDAAKTQLFTNVSHEFRTPLTVIQGIAEQLDKNPDRWLNSGPPIIKNQSRILLRLVNQMLDIAKIETEGMRLEPIQGNLAQFIVHAADSFRELADYRRVELRIEIPDKEVFMDYDPEKMMLVVSNLLSNAIKFTPEQGSVSIGMSTEISKEGKVVYLTVRDTGRGIAKPYLDRIFDRFYQAPDSGNETQGTGLGLAITRELIHLMNGSIRVESEPGKGSVFFIRLPVTNNAPPGIDHGIAQIHAHAPGELENFDEIYIDDPETGLERDDKKPHLLIVEDNREVRGYLYNLLADHYVLSLANDGKEGYFKTWSLIPDLVLSDVMMPHLDGFEMLQQIRTDHRTDHIPVVFLTARGDMESKLQGLEIGADHYLVKPFSEEELFLKLNNLMRAREVMQRKLGSLRGGKGELQGEYKTETRFIESINKLLEQELGNEEFGIQALCDALHMSRPQLYRKFKALTNNSIGKYIQTFKLFRAKEMMELKGKNVTEAAMDSGFRNLSHFSALFRKEFGYPPSRLLKHD